MNPINHSISAMQKAYGLLPTYDRATDLRIEGELEALKKTFEATTFLTEEVREKAFNPRPLQFGTTNPFLIIFNLIYSHISNKINSFLNQKVDAEKSELFFLANSLKNHGYISQDQFIKFKESYETDKEHLKNTLKKIILTLYKESKIDRKIYFHLTLLSHNDRPKEVLQFLFGLSSISNIHRFKDNLKEITSAQEQLEMVELIKKAYDHSSFSDHAVKVFSNLTARLEIYHWLKNDGIEDSNLAKTNLIKTLKSNDLDAFKKEILAYLNDRKTKSASDFEERFFEELILSFDHPKSKNLLIHFSQSLESLSVLKDWEIKVTTLETELKKTLFLDERDQKRVLKQLTDLYRVFGKILENEKEFRASPLAMGLQQGLLREKWRNIGTHLHRLRKNKISEKGHKEDHLLCGCIFDSELKKAWPDQENSEITDSTYIPKRNQMKTPLNEADLKKGEIPEKKIKVLGVYWNMGNGHRAPMQAMADYLGHDEFDISTLDLPQKALLHLDSIHQFAGGNYSATVIYNNLLAGKHFNWINFCRHIANGKKSEQEIREIKIAIREQILKERPDIIIASYANVLLQEVALELGIPIFTQGTDMDVRGGAFDEYQGKNDDHSLRGVPYETTEAKEHFQNNGYNEDNIQYTGFAVRPDFLNLREAIKNNEQEEIQKLRKKYGINEDEVVYVISNGGTGGHNPIMELLKKTQEGTIPKGHVFVITGRNKEFRENLKTFEEYTKKHSCDFNSGIILHIENDFTPPSRMSELLALATAKTADGKNRGLFIGKPGGSSLGETIVMGTQMLLEPNALAWEEFAAEKITKLKLGASLTNTNDLVRLVQEQTAVPTPSDEKPQERTSREEEIKKLTENNPEETIYTIVKTMVEKAEKDNAFMSRRTAWKSNEIFMRGIAEKGEALSYFDSLKRVDELLGMVDHKKRLTIPPLISSKNPMRIDFNKMELTIVKKYDPKEARLSVRYFIQQIETQKTVDDEFLNTASLYLDMVMKFHKNSFDNDFQKMRHDPFYLELSKLDRLIVKHQNPPPNLQIAFKHYKSPLTHFLLREWMGEKTAEGRKNNEKPFLIDDETKRLEAFVHHPEQVDWLNQTHLIRFISTYDHKLQVNKDGEITLLSDEVYTPISDLMHLTSIGKRLIDPKESQEYLYDHKSGLKKMSEENDPTYWKKTLPLFKKKTKNNFLVRKTNDYRIEICTNIGLDHQNRKIEHAWLRLKDKKGNIHSVGRVWNQEIDLPALQMTQILPGQPSAPDRYEFSTNASQTKTTKIQLSGEQYGRIKKYIEDKSSQMGFNLVNQNCVSFVNDVCRQLDLDLPTKSTFVEYFLPLPLSVRKFFVLNPWVRDVSIILLYPLTVVSHIFLGIFGGFKQNMFSPEQSRAIFDSTKAFLDPTKSLIDSPAQLRAWQEYVDESLTPSEQIEAVDPNRKRKSKIYNWQQIKTFSDKISQKTILRKGKTAPLELDV